MTELAGQVPASPNRALDNQVAEWSRKDKWHQKHATAIVSGCFGLMTAFCVLAWNTRAADITRQEARQEVEATRQETQSQNINKLTIAVERLTEMAISNTSKNDAQDKGLAQGREDRLASERAQDGKLAGLDTRIAVAVTKIEGVEAMTQRIMRKLEEARRTDGAPFDQNQMWNVPPSTPALHFPPILKATAKPTLLLAQRRPASRVAAIKRPGGKQEARMFGPAPQMWRSAVGTRMAYRW